MKLFKKLLPVATIAATTAIVVPMVASCGQTVLTNSKLDFTPDQHDPVEGGLSEEEATKELFSDTKYFAQEIAYDAIINGLGFLYYVPFEDGHKYHSKEFTEKHNNATYEFTTSIKNVSLTEAKATIDSKEVKGYLLSAEIVDEVKAKGEVKTIETEGATKVVDDYSQKGTITLKDIFVYATYDSSSSEPHWEINISALKSASKNWSLTIVCKGIELSTTTFKDGHETTDREDGNIAEHLSCQQGSDDLKDVLSPIDSYYLKNISKKA